MSISDLIKRGGENFLKRCPFEMRSFVLNLIMNIKLNQSVLTGYVLAIVAALIPIEMRSFVLNLNLIMKNKLSQSVLAGFTATAIAAIITGCGRGQAQQQMPPPNVTVATV